MIALLTCLLALAETPETPNNHDEVWIQASETVVVTDRRAAAETLIAAATKEGGYFSTLTDANVVLRVPVASVPAVLAVGASLGTVQDRSFQSQDLSEELQSQQLRLRSRQEALDRYLAVLRDAGADALVAVGRQVDASIGEIERIQGRIRLLEHQATYAQISVSFQYRDRSAPLTDGTSSFAWINQLNLSDLLRDFKQQQGGGHSPGVNLVLPPEFAAFSKPSRFAALTADDLKARVRVFRNKPKADLIFWKEAVSTRMKNAGYRIASDQTVQAKGGPVILLPLSAPSGDQDYTYWIALGVRGSRIVVVEIAGETSLFSESRQATLRTALESLEF